MAHGVSSYSSLTIGSNSSSTPAPIIFGIQTFLGKGADAGTLVTETGQNILDAVKPAQRSAAEQRVAVFFASRVTEKEATHGLGARLTLGSTAPSAAAYTNKGEPIESGSSSGKSINNTPIDGDTSTEKSNAPTVAAGAAESLGSASASTTQKAAISTGTVSTSKALSVSPNLVGGLLPPGGNTLPPRTTVSWTASYIASLTSSQIQSISTSIVSGLTPSQVADFTPAQIAQFSTAQIGALLPTNIQGLTPSQIAALSGAQIAAFSTTQYTFASSLLPGGSGTGNVTLSALNELSAGQLASIATSALPGLTPTQLVTLTNAQVAGFTAAQAQAFSSSQFPYFSPAAVSGLSTSFIGAVNASQIANLVLYQFVGGHMVNVGAPANLTAAQVGAISLAALPGLTTAELQQFTAAAVSGFSPTQIAALSTSQLSTLGIVAFSQLQGLAPAQIAGVSPNAFALLSPSQLNQLSPAQLGALTAQQGKVLTGAQIAGLSLTNLQSLSTAAVAAFNFATNQIPASVIPNFTLAQTAAIDSTFTASQEQALTPAQISVLNAGLFSLGGPQFISLLTPSQLAAATPAQIASVYFGYAGGFTATQVPLLNTAQFQALNAAQLQYFTQAAVQSITPSQLALLTSSQLQNTVSAIFILNLAPSQVGDLSSSQLNSLLPLGASSLTAAQTAALGASTVEGLTPQFLSQLTSSALAGLSVSAFAALTRSQVSALSNTGQITGAQFEALGSDALAGFSPTQIAQFTGAQLAAYYAAQATNSGVSVTGGAGYAEYQYSPPSDPASAGQLPYASQAQVGPVSAGGPSIADDDFASPSIAAAGEYSYATADTPWSFAGTSGVSASATPFTSGTDLPSGNNAAFVQGTGAVSQSVANFQAGQEYRVSFAIAQQPGNNQNINVLVDGKVVATVDPTSSTFALYSSAPFSVSSSGTHTITFQGVDSAGSSDTALLAGVTIDQVLQQSSGTRQTESGAAVAAPVLSGSYATNLANGVYLGMTGAGNPFSPFTHDFIGVVNNGVEQTIEFGPDSSGKANVVTTYGNTLENATYGYVSVPVPAGMTLAQFQGAVINAGLYYENNPESALPNYGIWPTAANCENVASGVLTVSGTSNSVIQSLTSNYFVALLMTPNNTNPYFQFPYDISKLVKSGATAYYAGPNPLSGGPGAKAGFFDPGIFTGGSGGVPAPSVTNVNYTADYGQDANGNKVFVVAYLQVFYSDGSSITYEYDANGNIIGQHYNPPQTK